MDGLKQELRGHGVVLRYLYYVVKFVVVGFLWDVPRLCGLPIYCAGPGTNPEGSIGMQRVKNVVLSGVRSVGLEWRDCDSSWSGIRGLWRWYWEAIRRERELKRFEQTLRPLFEKHHVTGKTLVDRVNNLAQIINHPDGWVDKGQPDSGRAA